MTDIHPTDSSQPLASLGIHERRRANDLPTLSVLVGPVELADRYWRQWAAEAGYRTSVHSLGAPPAELVPAFVDHVRRNGDLPRLALNALLRRAGRPGTASTSPLAAPLDGRTPADVDALAAPALAEPDPAGTAAVAHEICKLAVTSPPASAADLAERLDRRLAGRPDGSPWRILRALDELLPVRACPAVLLTAGPATAGDSKRPDPATIEASARSAAMLAQAVPGWPVALAWPAADFARYRRTAAESQANSLVTTGTIHLPAARSRQGKGVERPAGGVDPNLLAEVAEVAKAARAHALAVAAAADAARSAAERLLFTMLESNERTKGQFAPNGSPGFQFGARPAEVDLLAAALRLAVEVDGYFHFTDADAYRRDRRKDWLLQQHGYTVVRVLAEDVPAHMQKVLDFLLTVVEHCRQASSGQP